MNNEDRYKVSFLNINNYELIFFENQIELVIKCPKKNTSLAYNKIYKEFSYRLKGDDKAYKFITDNFNKLVKLNNITNY